MPHWHKSVNLCIRSQIRSKLIRLMQINNADVLRSLKEAILHIACEGMSDVLSTVNTNLDRIELNTATTISLFNANDTKAIVNALKTYLARTRMMTFHYSAAFSYLDEETGALTSANSVKICNHVRQTLDSTKNRLDNFSQTLMATMSIIESQRGIREAESVGKLTELAFFFIPITFIASLFGMNVVVGHLSRIYLSILSNATSKEFEGNLTWRIWAVTSVCCMILSYMALFRRMFWKWFPTPSAVHERLLPYLLLLLLRWYDIRELCQGWIRRRWIKICTYWER
ncbi:hypothetical protein BKA67DRAFT_2412 [Truncatella angustata]|uniref:Uncharacterized protein n=1 Tax=Truncatella angustata TaxID=152316 RepID=A0A9P8UV89_9PEZI|nr:uncharacterized protein BKA67DRAFT_2412 [Truncatella angustata]KAH6658960.1 hypothetical protein BKA67DRAFT_2412 [Truncatella angustata]